MGQHRKRPLKNKKNYMYVCDQILGSETHVNGNMHVLFENGTEITKFL
jgi:hypothetical protein